MADAALPIESDPSQRPLGETLTPRQKWLLLGSCLLALFITALDQTIVATATPKIVADLKGFHLLSWLLTSYMLSSTVIVPLVGKLSDIYGRKYFLVGGNVIFLIASVACGAAPTMLSLIIFRVVQGIGGGMILSSVFATTGDLFPPAERIKYMGLFTGVFSLASVLGPTAGGFLTDHGGWRWIFFINVPISLVAIPAVWRNLPVRKSLRRPKIDFAGAALLTIGSVALLLAMEWAGGDYSWTSPQIIGLIAVAVVMTVAFIFQERRHPEPLIPLFLFKNQAFALSNAAVFILGVGMFGSLQYLSIYVQTALGKSATASGVISTPQSAGLLIASTLGGQLIARTGRYRYLTMTGAVLIVIAMFFLMRLELETPVWHISTYMVVLGLGFGLMMPTMSMMSQNAVEHQYIGVATSVNQFSRQIGSVLGIAVLGALLASTFHSSFADDIRPETRAAIGEANYETLDDPTIRLNPGEFNPVRHEVLQLPEGQAILDEVEHAQRQGVTDGVRDIYLVAFISSLIGLGIVLIMKEIPLRRTFNTVPEPPKPGTAGGPPAGEPARASGPRAD